MTKADLDHEWIFDPWDSLQMVNDVNIICKGCNRVLSIPKKYIGVEGKCIYCGKKFVATAESAPKRQPQIKYSIIAFISCIFIFLFAVYFENSNQKNLNQSQETQVYISNFDCYYYYFLSPRAVSLGLTLESSQISESMAIAMGYEAGTEEIDALEVDTEQKQSELQAKRDSAIREELIAISLAEKEMRRKELVALKAKERAEEELRLWEAAQEEQARQQQLIDEAHLRDIARQEAIIELENELFRVCRECVLRYVNDPANGDVPVESFSYRYGSDEETYVCRVWFKSRSRDSRREDNGSYELEIREHDDFWKIVYIGKVGR